MKIKKAKPKLALAMLQLCLALCLLIAAVGCESPVKNGIEQQIDSLRREKKQLESQLNRSQAENEQLQNQIKVLSGLPSEVKAQDIYDLRRVKITRYTNFYDKDKDGRKEKLIVYLRPSDANGDIIKAGGSVDVQLWDLNKSDSRDSLLGKWHVKSSELKEMWFAGMLTTNYRFVFDISDKVQNFDKPLTVKITFTDHLSGKVFTQQKVIKPK